MRKVSHLPPANAISELAKAAPPFVTLVPSTMMVAPAWAPASSSVISLTARWPSGNREPRSTEARLWSVTPLARSTTAGGRSSWRSPTTHCASCRLSDAIGSASERDSPLQPEGGDPAAVVERGVLGMVLHVRLPGPGVHGGGHEHVVLLLRQISLDVDDALLA